MKHIGTLVSDIQSVLTSHELTKDAVEAFGKQLAVKLTERLCEGSHSPALRMSNFATPDRKLWYTVNKPELAEPLSGATRMKFLYGDLTEELLLFLAKETGHVVECVGMEVEYNGVKGHVDCIIDGVLVDIKSASGRSYNKFRNHELVWNDPFGYLDQLSLYCLALRDSDCLRVKGQGAFLAFNKESGEICLDIYNVKKDDYEKETVRKTGMLEGSTLPDRCYDAIPHGASGNRRLPMECSWCPFRKTCWADSNMGKGIRSFAYSSGRVDLVSVQREPEVEEIT